MAPARWTRDVDNHVAAKKSSSRSVCFARELALAAGCEEGGEGWCAGRRDRCRVLPAGEGCG